MSDSFSLLREYNMENKEIIEKDGRIIFGEMFFPKDWRTHCAVSRPSNDGETEYYTLNCLLFLIKNKHLLHPEYCNAAAAQGIPAVRRPDRNPILKYLNGETNTYMPVNAGKDNIPDFNILGKRPIDDGNNDDSIPGPKRTRGKRKRNRKRKNQPQ